MEEKAGTKKPRRAEANGAEAVTKQGLEFGGGKLGGRGGRYGRARCVIALRMSGARDGSMTVEKGRFRKIVND